MEKGQLSSSKLNSLAISSILLYWCAEKSSFAYHNEPVLKTARIGCKCRSLSASSFLDSFSVVMIPRLTSQSPHFMTRASNLVCLASNLMTSPFNLSMHLLTPITKRWEGVLNPQPSTLRNSNSAEKSNSQSKRDPSKNSCLRERYLTLEHVLKNLVSPRTNLS